MRVGVGSAMVAVLLAIVGAVLFGADRAGHRNDVAYPRVERPGGQPDHGRSVAVPDREWVWTGSAS
jgi:hypothetical protein